MKWEILHYNSESDTDEMLMTKLSSDWLMKWEILHYNSEVDTDEMPMTKFSSDWLLTLTRLVFFAAHSLRASWCNSLSDDA